jgi:hypothetical protein
MAIFGRKVKFNIISIVRFQEKMKKIFLASLFLLLLPQVAWAEDILRLVIIFAMVPLVNAIIVILFSIFSHSVKAFLFNIGLVPLWVVFFWFFTSYTGSDFLAWLPILLSIAHSLYLMFRTFRVMFLIRVGSKAGGKEIKQ